MTHRFRFLSLYAVLFLVFLYAPAALLPVFSFNDSTFAVFPLKAFTLKHYEAMFANLSMLDALRNSIVVGVIASVAATAIGIPLAIGLARRLLPAGSVLLATVMLPLVVPSIIFAVAFLVILVRILQVDLSLWSITIAHVFLCLPFSVMVLMSRLDGLGRSLEEASRDLGETALGTFRRVTLPLILPAVISSLLMCFITSFDEFVLAFFLSGTQPTLPVFLYGQLRFPNKLPSMLALGSVILIVSTLLVILSEVIRRRGVAGVTAGDA
ncbi:ABC transporter permease [Rhizobium sp. TRM95111]|uniref:ABC transporter permease n=1 Tax=Rhizobium alarense TaxID=2846851 RepID=UPI001F3F87FB|nr:ABC transporter permease [Rhizobium alarense]MCF3639233.1 ABC transporter permease [Rhizobium alarense]